MLWLTAQLVKSCSVNGSLRINLILIFEPQTRNSWDFTTASSMLKLSNAMKMLSFKFYIKKMKRLGQSVKYFIKCRNVQWHRAISTADGVALLNMFIDRIIFLFPHLQ